MRFFMGNVKKGRIFGAVVSVFAILVGIYTPVFADDITRTIDDHTLYDLLKGSWSLSCATFNDDTYSITVSETCRNNVTYLYLDSDKSGEGVMGSC